VSTNIAIAGGEPREKGRDAPLVTGLLTPATAQWCYTTSRGAIQPGDAILRTQTGQPSRQESDINRLPRQPSWIVVRLGRS
jgi:hypothetical protein